MIADYRNKSFKFYPGDEWPVDFDVTFFKSGSPLDKWFKIGTLEGSLLVYGEPAVSFINN